MRGLIESSAATFQELAAAPIIDCVCDGSNAMSGERYDDDSWPHA